MLVIPDLKNQNGQNKLKPKVDLNTLKNVRLFLEKRTSEFINIHVKNPDYEQVEVVFKVAFHKGFEYGYYSKELNKVLIEFLTPWAFKNTSDIQFGKSVHKSLIISFLESIKYVDSVHEVQLNHIGKDGTKTTDLEEITASSPRAILVSAEKHGIDEK